MSECCSQQTLEADEELPSKLKKLSQTLEAVQTSPKPAKASFASGASRKSRAKGKGKTQKLTSVGQSTRSDSDSEDDEWSYATNVLITNPASGTFSDDALSPNADFYSALDFLQHPDDGSTILCYEYPIFEAGDDGDPDLRNALAWKFVLEEVLSLPDTKWIDWFTEHQSGSVTIVAMDTTESPHVQQFADLLAEHAFRGDWQETDRQPSIQVFYQRGDVAPPKGNKVVEQPVFRLRSFAVTPGLIYRRHLPYTARKAHNDRLARSEEALQTLQQYNARRPRATRVIDNMPEARKREEEEARYYDPQSGHPRTIGVSRLVLFEGMAGGLIPDLTLGNSSRQNRYEDWVDKGVQDEFAFLEIFHDTFGSEAPHWIRVSKSTSDETSGNDTRLTTMLSMPSQPPRDETTRLFIVTKYPASKNSQLGVAEQRDPGRFGNVPAGVKLSNEGPPERRQFSTASRRQRGRARGRKRQS